MSSETTSISDSTSNKSSMFRKDFSMSMFRQRPRTIPVPPIPQQPPEPPKSEQPIETTHHSTLLLLEKLSLPQVPAGHWDNKNVAECPPNRVRGGRTKFVPDSPVRQAENRDRRYFRDRKAQRDIRSQQEGWLEGPAQRVAEALEEVENVRGDLRDAARWGNMLLEHKEIRKAEQKGWFSGKEPEEEMRTRLQAETAAKNVMPMEWTRAHEQPILAPSSASVRSVSIGNRNSILSTNSMLSTTTTATSATTPRSSIMSNSSSPASSEMPSPVLSTTSKDSGPSFWRRRVSAEDKIRPLKLNEDVQEKSN
ncbi:hypothetical protein EDC01DRAFT_629633 [Geopyxis carbonaria]|nr:hypothetical protein EDC01DRAFT_629633 [Geopyxis carbonaria]